MSFEGVVTEIVSSTHVHVRWAAAHGFDASESTAQRDAITIIDETAASGSVVPTRDGEGSADHDRAPEHAENSASGSANSEVADGDAADIDSSDDDDDDDEDNRLTPAPPAVVMLRCGRGAKCEEIKWHLVDAVHSDIRRDELDHEPF